MTLRKVLQDGPTTALLFTAATVAWATVSAQPTSKLGVHQVSARPVREERTVVVGSSPERWALEWLSQPEAICTPEVDLVGWMTCPCDGFAFGEQGHLVLVRHRSRHEDERLALDTFFRAAVASPGLSVVQLFVVRKRDLEEPTGGAAAHSVRSRPVVDLMSFADYDHDGAATEFTLKVGNAACGHDEVVVIGVSRDNPALHVFGTAEHPNVPLVLKREGWDSLRRSTGETTFVDFACGDHGSEHQSEIHLVTRPDGIYAEALQYDCAGPGYSRGHLLSHRDL